MPVKIEVRGVGGERRFLFLSDQIQFVSRIVSAFANLELLQISPGREKNKRNLFLLCPRKQEKNIMVIQFTAASTYLQRKKVKRFRTLHSRTQ